jgi:hypothetical protein
MTPGAKRGTITSRSSNPSFDDLFLDLARIF